MKSGFTHPHAVYSVFFLGQLTLTESTDLGIYLGFSPFAFL